LYGFRLIQVTRVQSCFLPFWAVYAPLRAPLFRLPPCEVDDGTADAVDTGEVRRLEGRRVGDGRVGRADAADRGVQQGKEVLPDVRGDLGADAPAEPVLMDDQHPARARDRFREGVEVERKEGPQVDHLGLDA